MIDRHSFWLTCVLLAFLALGVSSDEAVNYKGFRDPNTGVAYVVASYNVTQMTTDSTHRSEIRVARGKLDPSQRFPVQRMETIQTLRFHPSLVDFDLACMPEYCYLVCVTSRTKRNVELYKWTRTQFDLQAKKDSFARPHAVRIFRIAPTQFYIAIAQDQLHLSPYRQQMVNWDDDDDDEPTRFIGCAVFKFARGQERNIKYHQFIRLPFNPHYVHHYKSMSSNNLSDARAAVQPFENHYLLFSLEPNWADPGASQVYSYLWNSQNDYFWPYRMPRDAEVLPLPYKSIIRLPAYTPGSNVAGVAQNLTQPQEYIARVEACFHQLERLLADRDHRQRELIQKSSNVWRAPNQMGQQQSVYGPMPTASLTNITAQVIVRGNVTVIGSLIESPQISLFNSQGPVQLPSSSQLAHFLKMHSPSIVENKFKLALFKLNYIREKLSRAVLANLPPQSLSYFNNQIRFYGGLEAREVVLAGVANSNVRLNQIQFKQLENELVSLIGSQDIGPRVVFDGRVVADVLEIHGRINDHYLLSNAIDITARQVQVIDTTGQNYIMRAPGMGTLDFASIGTPEVILAHNATMNSIHLGDFITRDERTQIIYGPKSFKRLSMARLDLAHSGVALNGFNITQVARQAIRLRPDSTQQVVAPGTNLFQTINAQRASFMKPVRVQRLTLNNAVNQHINMSSLIYDSVKTNDMSLQQIFGQKSFMNKLRINRLTTEGSLNGILVSQVFNLNQAPPTADHYRFANSSSYAPQFDVPIEGKFHFNTLSHVFGSVSASLVNGVDLARRAVQRAHSNLTLSSRPQIVHGHKTFYRPLRVINRARLIDVNEINSLMGNDTRRLFPYPLVNNIDLRLISAGLDRQMRQPPLVHVDTLEIDGNLNIPTSPTLSNRTTLGSYSICPLDAIRSRAVLAGLEDQFVETPIRVNSLRAKSIVLDSAPLNDFYFPQDFVLRTSPSGGPAGSIEPVFGVKTFEHLVVSPPALAPHNFASGAGRERAGVILDRGASINQVPHSELQAFVQQEQRHGSTGETVFNTMNVYGNLHVKRINDQFWPDDILLKSVSSTPGILVGSSQHKRIYSHLIFANSSNLRVNHHLYLRGPVQLEGRMNGVNLTEFSRQSATYYDKDLYTIGRPIRNKVFMGGLTVKGEIRSQGRIDGVNFDEMRRRVVTVGNRSGRQLTRIASPKIFLSDAVFEGPVQMIYLDDLPIDHHLRRIRFEPDGTTLKVHGKKTITGVLRINRNLFVRGLINGVDFADLKARAISLAPASGELTFNKTLTVEGDIFMDNLWIDERNGTIDGVRLTNLLPIGTLGKNELILDDFNLDRRADPYGRIMQVGGSLMDCRVSCDLHELRQGRQPIGQPQLQPQPLYATAPSQQQNQQAVHYVTPGRPLVWPTHPVVTRPAFYNQGSRNFTLTRTTPPYSLSSSYQPPIEARLQPMMPATTLYPIDKQRAILLHPPKGERVSIIHEMRVPPPNKRYLHAPDAGATSLVVEQLESLRRHFISTTIVRLNPGSQFVVGFIQAATNDIGGYELPEPEELHLDHEVDHRPNYKQLDQVDLSFGRAIHTHLSVGVSTNLAGPDITSVYSLLGGRNLTELSMLPITNPRTAKFVTLPDAQLLLLISQNQTNTAGMCPASEIMRPNNQQLFGATNMRQVSQQQAQYSPTTNQWAEDGVYVFHLQVLKNSSSLTSTFFDLYQTLDLPYIDRFEKFTYRGSTYVLAISRDTSKIYLLLMRGYTAFQLVSDMDVPSLDFVNIMYTPQDQKPVLVIHQTSGIHRVMEAVII